MVFQRIPKPIWRFGKIPAALAGLWFVAHAAYLLADGLSDDVELSDVAVVLGNKVNADGTPSDRLRSRLDTVRAIYLEKMVRLIVVSGGVGVEGHDEAKVMADYLADRGVSREHIVTDSKGNNTYLTAKRTSHIMAENALSSAIVVTQYYHISRAKLALRKFGIRTVRGAHARMGPELRDPYSLLREIIAYYYYLVRTYE